MYLFGRDVAYLISLNTVNLNNRKVSRKGYLRVILQLGMRSLCFLRNALRYVYTSLHDRLLTANRCFSDCIELITENQTHHVNLT